MALPGDAAAQSRGVMSRNQPSMNDAMIALKEGNYSVAIDQLWSLASRGDTQAQFYLAHLLESGKGGNADYVEAAQWYREAAESGHIQSQAHLGYLHSIGRGVLKDDKEAVRWYMSAAQQGDASAQNNLGTMFRQGRGVPEDKKQAAQWYMQAAMQGHTRGQYNLASMYLTGEGIQQDETQAVRWMEAAASSGDMFAQAGLAYMLREGKGIAQDLAAAAQWYHKAASQGHTESQYQLGLLYESNGPDPAAGASDALRWYQAAAGKGHLDATYRMASLYEKGLGVRKNETQAYDYYITLADKGYAPGQRDAGRLLIAGRGTAPNRHRGKSYLMRAAEQGDGLAMYYLAQTFYEGLGGEKKDSVEAYRWYSIASEFLPDGREKNDSLIARAAISKTINDQALDMARQRAEDWIKKYVADRDRKNNKNKDLGRR